MIVGFDLDGVIIDHSESRIVLARQKGYSFTLHQTPTQIFNQLLPEHILRAVQYDLYDDPVTSLRSPLMPHARDSLTILRQRKVPMVLISRRKESATAIALLRKHDIWPMFFHEKNVFFVDTPEDKDMCVQKLGVTHYIDDEIRVLNTLASVPNRFLFDPFNIFPASAHYLKLASWKEFLLHC